MVYIWASVMLCSAVVLGDDDVICTANKKYVINNPRSYNTISANIKIARSVSQTLSFIYVLCVIYLSISLFLFVYLSVCPIHSFNDTTESYAGCVQCVNVLMHLLILFFVSLIVALSLNFCALSVPVQVIAWKDSSPK